MTRQVFQDDMVGSRMTQQSWDHRHQHQYESHKTPTFTPALTPTQIPAHITVHPNNWSHEHTKNPDCMPSPTERHNRCATPHWKIQRKEFGYKHNSYERNNYSGPRWQHNDIRHRPFVPRLNETGNVPKGVSIGYNPSRFRYVSDSYLRSLKENNITCSQTSQQRNVQIAVIKPIARVESLKKDEIVSSCEVAFNNHKDNKNKDNSKSFKSDESSATKEDDTILEILDYQVVSSDICSTNEKQNRNKINSNCIEIKSNVSALLKGDSNFSNNNMKVSSNSKIKRSSEDQNDKTSSATKLTVCDVGETNLPPVIPNLLVRHSLGEHINETECISEQESVHNAFDKLDDLYDPSISNTKFDISAKQYKEKIIERIDLPDVSVKDNQTVEVAIKVVMTNSPNTYELLVATEPPKLHSPVKYWSPRKPSQECLSLKEPSQDENFIRNEKSDGQEYLSVKPFSPSKKPKLQITQRINEKSLHKIPFQNLDESPTTKNIKSLNSDVLTPEMLRERLFRKFINSSELIIPAEKEMQDQNFLIEREKTIESLMSSTLKMAGIFPTEFKDPPKQDKPPLSIKTEQSILSNISTNSNTEDLSSSKQLNTKSNIENHVDSFHNNLPVNLFNENTLKILSDANLFSNLDIHILKDILAKIEAPSIEPVSETIKNTEFEFNCENTYLQNKMVTNNPKFNCVNNTAIKSEILKEESNKNENMSPEKIDAVLPVYEEEMDTSLMLNLESVEECMLNSVSVICLQSEIWENNELDKQGTNCIKREIICEKSHAPEASSLNKVDTNNNHLKKTELATEIICEKPLDSSENLGCTLEEIHRGESNIRSDVKLIPGFNSSLKTCSSNNEILSNDTDIELSTIEYNLNQIFGMKEENNLIVPEQSANVNTEQNKLKPIKIINEDVISSTTDDFPKKIEHKCEFFILENAKSTSEIADMSNNQFKNAFIEYSPSMKVTDNCDSISISSDEVGDGDECFPGEENFDSRHTKDDPKLVEDENQGADRDLEKSKSVMTTSINEIDNGCNDIDLTSNVKKAEKENFEFDINNTNYLLVCDNKISGFVKSKVKFHESKELGKTFETDDDLPDLNKTNLEKLFNHKTEDDKECNFNIEYNFDTESANGNIKSERAYIPGTSDLHKTDILKWKVSQKRACIFSKENIQSFQVTGSSKKYSQKQSEENYISRDTLTTESMKCENLNDVASQKNGLLEQINCNIKKMINNSPVKHKRLCQSDFSEHIPKKKVYMKTSLKCKPKDRKRRINRVSTCLSPKSLSKALETSSYIIEDEVSNMCPLGHLLEKSYSTVNVNTDRISVYCKSCKKTIFMGEST